LRGMEGFEAQVVATGGPGSGQQVGEEMLV
jgi:hypothetical protein